MAFKPVPHECEFNGAGGWIRTIEAYASDLQSDPFGRSGTPAENRRHCPAHKADCQSIFLINSQSYSSSAIKNGAGERNRTPDRLITSQLLYLLSYASFLTTAVCGGRILVKHLLGSNTQTEILSLFQGRFFR